MNTDEYQDLLKIDKFSLDYELMNQADLYNVIAQEYAQAVSSRDALYQETKQVYAELYTKIREEASDEGRKVTESQLENEIRASTPYKETVAGWLAWKEDADKLQALKDAFEQRGRMLTRLVELYIAGYWADTTGNSIKGTANDLQYESNRAKIRENKESVNYP